MEHHGEGSKAYRWKRPQLCFRFAKDELAVDLESTFRSDDTWSMLLTELHEFTRAHSARVEARLRTNGENPECCDECGELTVPMRGGSCELCGHWQFLDDDI